MKTQDQCQEIAVEALGGYLTACQPEATPDVYKAVTLMLSFLAHSVATMTTKEHAADLLNELAVNVVQKPIAVDIVGNGPAHPTIQ